MREQARRRRAARESGPRTPSTTEVLRGILSHRLVRRRLVGGGWRWPLGAAGWEDRGVRCVAGRASQNSAAHCFARHGRVVLAEAILWPLKDVFHGLDASDGRIRAALPTVYRILDSREDAVPPTGWPGRCRERRDVPKALTAMRLVARTKSSLGCVLNRDRRCPSFWTVHCLNAATPGTCTALDSASGSHAGMHLLQRVGKKPSWHASASSGACDSPGRQKLGADK